VLFLFIYLLFSANGKELTMNLILFIQWVFLFLLFFIYIEMGITDTDVVKERFNSYLHQSSLFYLILFYFVIIESAAFLYHSSSAYIQIGNKSKFFNEYYNSDGVVISVEVDMKKFLFVFFFCFLFIYLYIFNNINYEQHRRTVHFFREGKLIPYCGKNLPKSINFGVFLILYFISCYFFYSFFFVH
jgi:hypothetical protein